VRLGPAMAAMAGVALIGTLVAYLGADAVIRSLLAVGWTGFGTICLIHAALITVMGIAWWALLPGTRLWVPVWGRFVRDAGSEVLPLAQIGGYLLGARAIMFAGVSGAAAAASTIVDVTLEFLTQIAFTALSLFWLIQLTPGAWIKVPIAIGLAVAIMLAVGLLLAQWYGFDLFDRFAGRIGRDWADRTAAGAAGLQAAIAGIYELHAGLCMNFVLHLVCWIAATTESWLALKFAGSPLDFGAVLVIEGLLYAIRSVAFAVPNAIGVQEGAYIVLGESFGLTPEMALALSLLKRARDLVIGLPALAAWQLLESGRLWRRVPASK
jgi:glycosyltransferase 2 family protein